ncbi:MAG: hypothetical protein ACQEXJ_00470 [Myxococcota bacterium]
MSQYSLVDLYVPASAGSPEEVAEAAANAGLDALVYVAHTWEELPDEEEIAALAERRDRPTVHPALVSLGLGWRFALLLPEWGNETVYNAVEALATPDAIQTTVTEAGGCALPVSPRQSPDGEVMREGPILADEPPIGVVAQVAGGSELGRDLDTEDAGAAGRRILGATGPFGKLRDVGTFMTFLPGDGRDVDNLVDVINRGFGVAVERTEISSSRGNDDRRGGGSKRGERRKKRSRSRRGGRGRKKGDGE